MNPLDNVSEFVKKAAINTNPEMDGVVLDKVLDAHKEAKHLSFSSAEPATWRSVMSSPITKLAAAIAVATMLVISIAVVDKVLSPAYALEQTVEALKNVRFVHYVRRDDQERIVDERWIEIGMDGGQVRYRQQHPPWYVEQANSERPPESHRSPSMVITDNESTAVYRGDKRAVIIYDRKERSYTWHAFLGKALENLRQEGKVLKQNDEYRGQPAHKVWWPEMNSECYVDPRTKLPIALDRYEFSYGEPPAGTFEITIPDGYTTVDRRPGATGEIPQWLLEEDDFQKVKRRHFRQGKQAFVRGDFSEAAEHLEKAIGYDSWAWFWLGSAYYRLGKYELAIEQYNKLLEIYARVLSEKYLPYCNYARALAYAQLGDIDAAQSDFRACLPTMVRTLRFPSAGEMFEYADSPHKSTGEYNSTERRIVVNMINRLRVATGQNFGYDPAGNAEENEAAILAWEKWSKDSGKFRFTPNAELIVLPQATRQDNERKAGQ